MIHIIYTVYFRYLRLGLHQIYGHVPRLCIRFRPTLIVAVANVHLLQASNDEVFERGRSSGQHAVDVHGGVGKGEKVEVNECLHLRVCVCVCTCVYMSMCVCVCVRVCF